MSFDIWNRCEKYIRTHKHILWIAKKVNHLRRNIHTIWLHMVQSLLVEFRRHGIENKTFSKIKKYKCIHEGQRCFIICTGPSLTIKDVESLKHEYTFGVNSICKLYKKTDWRATYYGIIDHNVYRKICHDEEFQMIEEAFVSDTMLKKCGPLTIKNYVCFPLDMSEGYWHILTKAPIRFSDDVSVIVYDVTTVTYAVMQIAIYMGFKEIYLLGCDCDYSGTKQHFEDYGVKVIHNPEKGMLAAYAAAKRYAEDHGIKIYNATRGGKLEVFERVALEEILSRSSKKD